MSVEGSKTTLAALHYLLSSNPSVLKVAHQVEDTKNRSVLLSLSSQFFPHKQKGADDVGDFCL
jgi:hypothetical protein